ncbi:tail fiber domain-containing protein [Sphingomonas lutea]|uniref:Tail fiber domain-containing protein n=1 Tax=Sphingomonas lutea TaxID=1045317 RepID=A0A7G9SEU4_9SPHN|nr:lasso RiPP family leader peptide-containing protein [Sphingomonas lutea]QNN66369.1 tail fiber domain-containing protein [Sphingomonas lutea]
MDDLQSNGLPDQNEAFEAVKAAYEAPKLTVFGNVRDLTRTGEGSGADGGTTAGMTMTSDPAAKENVVRVGDHPLGIGLYLFDFKPAFKAACGVGRQFGVMADEVAQVLPAAVSVGTNGYRRVDYGMLGISHA